MRYAGLILLLLSWGWNATAALAATSFCQVSRRRSPDSSGNTPGGDRSQRRQRMPPINATKNEPINIKQDVIVAILQENAAQ